MEKYQYPLKDEFIEFCKTVVKNNKNKTFKNITLESAESYAEDYLPGLRDLLKKNDFEKDFLEVVPYLLYHSKYEECTQVLLRVYRAVKLEIVGNSLQNYRTAFNLYANFIQEYIDKPQNNFPSIAFPNNLSAVTISKELEKGIVYYYVPHKNAIHENGIKLKVNKNNKYNLWGLLKSRLRTQNRTSGDKIWLSLDLISKIDSVALQKYVDIINKNTIIYIDDNGCQKIIKCSDVWCLYLYKPSGQTNYSIKVTTKDDYKTYDVLTPTATLGKRTLMQVADISKVVIDHVKPIDQSLRDLDYSNLIPGLSKLSNAYKNAKSQLVMQKGSKIKDSDIVKEAKKILDNDQAFAKVKTKLGDELDLLLYDSWYRLMDSKENSAKSNNNMFIKFKTNNASNPSLNTVIGIIMEVKHSTVSTYMKVYQELSNPGINYVNSASYVNSTYPAPIDLTSFISKWGPEIL